MFEHLRVSERGGGDGGGVDEDDEGLRSMLSALKACWPGAHGLIVATSARQVGGEVPRHVRVPARPRGGISRTIGSRFTCLSIVSSLSIGRPVSLSNKFLGAGELLLSVGDVGKLLHSVGVTWLCPKCVTWMPNALVAWNSSTFL